MVKAWTSSAFSDQGQGHSMNLPQYELSSIISQVWRMPGSSEMYYFRARVLYLSFGTCNNVNIYKYGHTYM